ncbi:unnamed protein product [Urochloa humidicola]
MAVKIFAFLTLLALSISAATAVTVPGFYSPLATIPQFFPSVTGVGSAHSFVQQQQAFVRDISHLSAYISPLSTIPQLPYLYNQLAIPQLSYLYNQLSITQLPYLYNQFAIPQLPYLYNQLPYLYNQLAIPQLYNQLAIADIAAFSPFNQLAIANTATFSTFNQPAIANTAVFSPFNQLAVRNPAAFWRQPIVGGVFF